MSIITTRQQHTVLLTLKQLEKKLPQDHFCRVHRSIIVALDRITSFDNFQVTLGDMSFPIIKNYQKSLLDKVTILDPDADKAHPIQSSCTGEDYPCLTFN